MHSSTEVSDDARLERVFSRAELIDSGYTGKRITRAVAHGDLIRLRRDHYTLVSQKEADVAVRIGGRLTCHTAIASTGAFVLADKRTHVQVGRAMSRLRSPELRRSRWDRARARAVRLHWSDLRERPAARHMVSLIDAVRQLALCQPPRSVIATLDSLLFLGLMTLPDLAETIHSLPRRYWVLLDLVDARSESGPESLVRLMLRQCGVTPRLQVEIPKVGRVDFVVAGRLIIECDSEAHHSDWEAQKRDRARDVAAARQGYVTVRFVAADIMFRPDEVRLALRDILAAFNVAG